MDRLFTISFLRLWTMTAGVCCILLLGAADGPGCEDIQVPVVPPTIDNPFEPAYQIFPDETDFRWVQVEDDLVICAAFDQNANPLNVDDRGRAAAVESFHCRQTQGSNFQWVETSTDHVTCMEITSEGLLVDPSADKAACRSVKATYFIWWPVERNHVVCHELTIDHYLVDEQAGFDQCRREKGSSFRWTTVEGSYASCYEFASIGQKEYIVSTYADNAACRVSVGSQYRWTVQADDETAVCAEYSESGALADSYVAELDRCRSIKPTHFAWYLFGDQTYCGEFTAEGYYVDRRAAQEACANIPLPQRVYRWVKFDRFSTRCAEYSQDGQLYRSDVGLEFCRKTQGSRFQWTSRDDGLAVCQEFTLDGLLVDGYSDQKLCSN